MEISICCGLMHFAAFITLFCLTEVSLCNTFFKVQIVKELFKE